MTKLNDIECFDLWVAGLRSDKGSQYLYNKRKEHIDDLMELLIDNGVPQDDAQMLKNRVIEVLVTKEGMKGRDKHKGWKENTEDDFKDAIQLKYVLPSQAKRVKPMKNAQGYDPRIVKWAKEKFGDHIGEDIVIAAHQPLHTLWIMFMKDQHNLNGRM